MSTYTRIDAAVGEYLKNTGKTQQEFASELGISDVTLRWKRRGEKDWKLSEVIKVAEITGTDLDEFMREGER